MNIGAFKIHEISYKKHLQFAFYKNIGKGCREIAIIVGRSMSAPIAVCKKFSKSRPLTNLLRVSRPNKLTKVFDGHVTLPV